MRALALVAVAACYSPETRDCTVTCAAATDCAHGQVCGTDGFCAAPAAAGHCTSVDAATPPDLVTLEIMIMGPGTVAVEGVGVCDSSTGPHCTFQIAAQVARQLTATPGQDHELAKWSMACSGNNPTCALTPVGPLTQVGAKFQ